MLYESYVEPSNLGSEHNQESGPYVFRSNGEPYLVNNLSALTTLSDGQLISDVYQVSFVPLFLKNKTNPLISVVYLYRCLSAVTVPRHL